MELRDRILKTSRERFFKYGIRNVTTKDISEALGISKKTLYNEFDSKDSIVTEITCTYFQDHALRCYEIIQNAENAVEEIMVMMEYIKKTLNRLNISMVHDLMKYHPEGFRALEKHRSEHIGKLLNENLIRGKREGLYRNNLDNKVVMRLKTILMDVIPDEKYFSTDEFNIPKVHTELMTHFFYGISTMKGHELIDQYLNHKE